VLPKSIYSFLVFAVVIRAGEPAWKTKDATQWSREEAQQVLSNSPWVHMTEIQILRSLSESQMRDAGKMGMTHGVGLEALEPSIFLGTGTGKRLIKQPPARATLMVRWESAPVVRSAEMKTSDKRAPTWDGDYYAIAVYGVPGLEDQKTLPVELKKSAYLKRGTKDLKPAHVDLLFEDRLATVVYLFPRTQQITPADKKVWFVTQIGQLFLEQIFDLNEMQFQGKLEL